MTNGAADHTTADVWYTTCDGAHLQGCGGRHRRRQRPGRSDQAARKVDHAARGARRHRRVRGAVPDPARPTRSRSWSVGHRRRRHQAQDRVRGEPPRHDRHRPGRDVRQRRARHRRRAAVLPRLLRDRCARRRHREPRDRGHRRGLPPGGLRARRRRDRRAARPLPRRATTTSPASASASSSGAEIRPTRDLVAGDVDHRPALRGPALQRPLARAQGRARGPRPRARCAPARARGRLGRRRAAPPDHDLRRARSARSPRAGIPGRPPLTSPAAASSRIRRGSSRTTASRSSSIRATWEVPRDLPADRERRRSTRRRCDRTFNMGLGHGDRRARERGRRARSRCSQGRARASSASSCRAPAARRRGSSRDGDERRRPGLRAPARTSGAARRRGPRRARPGTDRGRGLEQPRRTGARAREPRRARPRSRSITAGCRVRRSRTC